MYLFDDDIFDEFMLWKKANQESFTWWSYVNVKSNLETALGFAKFYFPELVEVEGCYFLKDLYTPERFEDWKKSCESKKTDIEKMMNLYEINDLFNINRHPDGELIVHLEAMGNMIKLFWPIGFRLQYPDKNIVVSVWEEDEGDYFFTVYEDIMEGTHQL